MKRDYLLLLIDYNKVFNIKNLDLDYMNMLFDKGNKYFLFYFFGIVGILYNKEKYLNELFDSWKLLYNFKFKN